MVDYGMKYWSSERGSAFLGYMALFETIALFIVIPILYLRTLKKQDTKF